jgi:alpha-ribazole phosphatase
MKLTLIRHTTLQLSSGICYGQTDLDVTASFYDELNALRLKLNETNFDAIYTSPLQRCLKLAEALNIGSVQVDNRLKELDFGDWEMRAWDDIPREIFDIWAHDYGNTPPPNGETFSQLQQRGLSFLEDISHHHLGGNIAVVTHGGMIRALIAHVLNMPLKGLFRFTIDHASMTQISFDGAVPKIEFINR